MIEGDDEKRLQKNKRQVERQHARLLDPAYREDFRARSRIYQQRRREKPAFREKSREYGATYRAKYGIEAWRARCREYQRKYRATHREKNLKYQRDYQRAWKARLKAKKALENA